MAVFGETLRQARAYKGVTLKEAEQATRINRHHLAALEDENFAALPPLIYQRGIVRNYAAFLDLDPNKVLTMFEEAHGTANPASSIPMAVKPLEMPNHFTPNFAIIAFLVVLSAIVFAWVYSVYRGPSDVLPSPTMQTTVTPIATVDGAAPISATATATPARSGDAEDAALAASPEVDTAATSAADQQAARPMSDANERRTQVAEGRVVPTVPADTAARPTSPASASASASASAQSANVPGNGPEPTATRKAQDTPTPDAEATDTAATEEAQAADEAEVAAAEEAQAAEATQEAVSASMLTISFSPAADIYLTVTGDGVVIFDGNVAAGETVGPFDATQFSVYTSDAANTYITNLDSGTEFIMSSSSYNLP